jgi:hypothetical protein
LIYKYLKAFRSEKKQGDERERERHTVRRQSLENFYRSLESLHLAKDAAEVLRLPDIGLHHEALDAQPAYFGQRLFACGLIAVVVNPANALPARRAKWDAAQGWAEGG